MHTFAVLFQELLIDAGSFQRLDKLEVNRPDMRFRVHEREFRWFAAQYGAVQQRRLGQVNAPWTPVQRLMVDLHHLPDISNHYPNLGYRNALEMTCFMRHVSLNSFSTRSGRSLGRCLRDLRLRHLECALACLGEPLLLPAGSHHNQYHNTDEEPDAYGWKSIDQWGRRKGVE